jgi:hypothetical protein
MDKIFLQCVEEACNDLKTKIHEKIVSDIPPPNAESTLRRKAPKTQTLVNTGELLGSITYRISDMGDTVIGEVGVFKEKLVKRALANEYGTDRIPARSFLRSTYDENIDRILNKLQEDFLKKVDDKWLQQ